MARKNPFLILALTILYKGGEPVNTVFFP